MDDYRATPEQYRDIDREMCHLKEMLGERKFDPEKLLHHLREAREKRFVGDVLPMAPLLRFRLKGAELVNGIAFTPEAQVRKVRQWNIAYNWGLTEKDFCLPDPPAHPNAATVLVPYLSSPLATVQGLLRALGEIYPVCIGYGMERSLTTERLQLFAESPVGELRWETIQLDSPMPAPKEYQERWNTGPHAGVLAAALQCPGWLLQLSEKKMHPAAIPVYRLTPNDTVTSWTGPYEHQQYEVEPWGYFIALGVGPYEVYVWDADEMHLRLYEDEHPFSLPSFA